MVKNLIYEVVYRTVKSYLKESKMNFDFLYSLRNGSDITEYVLNYLSWSEMGKMNADYSIMASKLHQALMRTLSLYHDDENDRMVFSRILRYLRIVEKRVGIRNVHMDRNNNWKISFGSKNSSLIGKNDKRFLYINPYDFYDDEISNLCRKAIVFETRDGYKTGGTDYRPGSYNGSSGYYTTSAKMTDEMKQKIYSMGLVPALYVMGSYHENFIHSVGVLPEMVSELKRLEDEEGIGLYFECEFVD